MANLLKSYRDIEARVIEVGSWEGRSALFFLNYLPRAHLTCVDLFDVASLTSFPELITPSPALAKWEIDWEKYDPNIEGRFEANVAEFRGRVQKIKAPSNVALAELAVDGRKFDIAYIDGGHRAVDVYSDAIMVWPMMAPGGMIIFDDYQWGYRQDTREHPKPGIDCFLHAFEGLYRMVHNDYQIAIAKL